MDSPSPLALKDSPVPRAGATGVSPRCCPLRRMVHLPYMSSSEVQAPPVPGESGTCRTLMIPADVIPAYIVGPMMVEYFILCY